MSQSESVSVTKFVKPGCIIEAQYIDNNDDDDRKRWYVGSVVKVHEYGKDDYGNFVRCNVMYDDGEFVKDEMFYDDDYGDETWRLSSNSHLVQCVLETLECMMDADNADDNADDTDHTNHTDDTDDTDDDDDDDDDDDGDGDNDGDDDDDEDNEDDGDYNGCKEVTNYKNTIVPVVINVMFTVAIAAFGTVILTQINTICKNPCDAFSWYCKAFV
jgi:hypothetical protein